MKAKDLDKSFDNNENIVSHLNTAKARCIIGLFQNKNVEEANIKPFSFLEKRPNVDYLNIFNEEKVNNP